jgi:MFS family permease
MKVLFLSHRKTPPSLPIYFVNLFFSFHYAATIYVVSSYLENYFRNEIVSLFFILGAVGNIILFLLCPFILRRLGNRKFLFYLLALEIIATLGLALGLSALSVALFFILRGSILMLIYYSLDIFLEEISDNKKTGGIRGLYLTITNIAIASAPLLVAALALGDEYTILFWISALILMPALLIAVLSFHNKPVHKKHTLPHSLPLASFWKSLNIKRVSLASWVLEMFFVFMVIYTPIYLREVIGFDWGQIGVAFTIMLLPFVIFDWPVGRLADKKYGEKEIMSIGFFIMGASVLVMPFLGNNIFIWTAILFLSRVGASFVEITTESYFFKHVDSRDTGFISLYRLTRPVSIITGALLYAVSIYLSSIASTFFVVSIILFYGLKQSLYLKDTL